MSKLRYPKPDETEERLLKVEDPLEMKTEPGSEILVPATPEELAEDLRGHHEMHTKRHMDDVHIRGLGQVTPTSQKG